MPPTPAARVSRVQPPATLAAGEKARQLARQGREIIDLSQSSPWHTTPRHIIDAGIQALNDGQTNIGSPRGLPQLRQAMADKLARDNGRSVDPEGDVLVTPGSKMGLYDAINAYLDRGDEALVIEPTWVSFSQQVELAEGVPVSVPLSEEEEYYLSYARLKEYVTPQTRMVIVNNPNNPTGRVYTGPELAAVAQVAQENDLLALCDETYEYFTYDSARHLTLAALPGMAQRTLTSYTFTKAYAMAGWRLGCIVAPAALLEPLLKVHEQTASFVSPFVQLAGVAALQGPQDHLARWREDCNELRIRAADRLYQVPGVHCPLPEGATFLFPRYSADLTSVELADLLVEREGVVVTPGAGFGAGGEGHLRIALMRSPAEQVLEGVERVARVLESL